MASAAGSRRSAVPLMVAVRRMTPWLNSISSPGLTSLLGFAGAPLTFTRPPRIASTASARVLTRRAAHSHLSIRTGVVSITDIVPPSGAEPAGLIRRLLLEPAAQRGFADQRDVAVLVDPVAHPQLAHQAERVARTRSAAARGERARARLDRPAAGVQRGERTTLILGRDVQRVRARGADLEVPVTGRRCVGLARRRRR